MKLFKFVLALLVITSTSCVSGPAVNSDALLAIDNVAIVSASTLKLSDTETNAANTVALQKMLESSIEILGTELSNQCNWNVKDLDMVMGNEYLMEANTNIESNPYFEFWAKSRQDDLIGVDGLMLIPYRNLDPDKVPDPGPNYSDTYTNKVATQQVIVKELAGLCSQLGVDAVIVLFILKDLESTGDFNVSIGGERTLGTMKFNPTMVIIDKSGEVIYDRGVPTMDDLAPMNPAVPLYEGTGANKTLDLDDDSVMSAFEDLEQRTLAKLAGKVANLLVVE